MGFEIGKWEQIFTILNENSHLNIFQLINEVKSAIGINAETKRLVRILNGLGRKVKINYLTDLKYFSREDLERLYPQGKDSVEIILEIAKFLEINLFDDNSELSNFRISATFSLVDRNPILIGLINSKLNVGQYKTLLLEILRSTNYTDFKSLYHSFEDKQEEEIIIQLSEYLTQPNKLDFITSLLQNFPSHGNEMGIYEKVTLFVKSVLIPNLKILAGVEG